MQKPVVIVGAGLAGLVAARRLAEKQIPFIVLEAGSAVGGRIRSDHEGGYTFDQGFQIFLTAYPWAEGLLDQEALRVRPVKAGALVWDGSTFHRFLDPLRHPTELGHALTTPVVTWGDRLRIAKLAAELYPQDSLAVLNEVGNTSTAEFLAQGRFSERAERSFLRPFFGGVFLDRELTTGSNLFRFLFRVFGTGAAGLPAGGMGAITQQLASRLPAGSVRLNTPVAKVEEGAVLLRSGEHIEAAAVIVAVDQSARNELGFSAPERPWHASVTLYFEAEESPLKENILALNGSGEGFLNSVLCVSDVAPEYSETGKALLSVSLLGLDVERAERGGEEIARQELEAWFGKSVQGWRLLKRYLIRRALPAYAAGTEPLSGPETGYPGVFACGDYLATPSQQGAADSGQAAGDAAIAYVRAPVGLDGGGPTRTEAGPGAAAP